MPQPTPYDRQANFTDYSSENPGVPHSGTSLDAEFAAAKVTLDGILANLALIQRDDGQLANGCVGIDSLGLNFQEDLVALAAEAPEAVASAKALEASASATEAANSAAAAAASEAAAAASEASTSASEASASASAASASASAASASASAASAGGAVDALEVDLAAASGAAMIGAVGGGTVQDKINTLDGDLDGLVTALASVTGGGMVGVQPGTTLQAKLDALDASLVGKADDADIAALDAQHDAFVAALAAEGGSSAVGYKSAGAGAVARDLQTKVREAPLNPKDFGAVGDGVTDDKAALDACFTYAFANSRGVDGGGAIYAVNGNLEIAAITRPWIRSLRLKQLNPITGRITLYFNNCQRIRIDKLEIDVGSGATVGDMNSTFGLYVNGGSNHVVSNVEVFGSGKLSLIGVWSATNSIFENLRARDCTFDEAAAADDRVQGIWIYQCTNVTVKSPVVTDLTGNAGAGSTRFTRGMALGGCVRVSVVDPKIANVDQGIDISGSAGNRQCSVVGGHLYQCATWGVKLANSAVNNRIVGVVAERCGMAGFVVSGPSEAGLTYKTSDNEFIGCTALDIGYNSIAFSGTSGFCIIKSSFDLDYPKGIRFTGCYAKDGQAVKTMKYGFFAEIDYDTAADKPNEVINGKAEGYTTARETGFHRYYCRVNGTGTQSINNATSTDLDWDAEVEDSCGMHSTTVGNNSIVLPVAGVWRIRAKVTWAVNGTGYRSLILNKNGSAQQLWAVQPMSGQVTTVTLDELLTCAAGDNVSLDGEQTSGGALTINRTQSWFEVELVRPS